MQPLASQLNTRAEVFLQNRTDALEALEQIDELLQQVEAGGGPEAMARLASRDKMPIRERIGLVLDPDSPFLEISPLAAWNSHYNVGSGFVLGIGQISGVESVILGHDPSVRAGGV